MHSQMHLPVSRHCLLPTLSLSRPRKLVRAILVADFRLFRYHSWERYFESQQCSRRRVQSHVRLRCLCHVGSFATFTVGPGHERPLEECGG